MPDRDQTPISINLSQRRAYRAKDTDRQATWVGPGKVTVPTWVAVAWALAEPTSSAPTGGGVQLSDEAGNLGINVQAQPPEPVADPVPGGLEGLDFLWESQIEVLVGNGYTTIQSLHNATDDELTSLNGIGPATVRNIRAVAGRGG